MEKSTILLEKVGLCYKGGKGISDISFSVPEGGVTGYLGPNGAGKTTTIRCLMGFMKPEKGTRRILGMDCFQEASEIKKSLGYIPGEMAFPAGMSCRDFLRYQCELRGIRDKKRMQELIDRFALDTKGSIRRFSKGMKQKLGIVSAFMGDPKVLILDEPTSGLDPLMQNEFIRLILEEKKRGKTILMSSHMFEEIERTCDDVVMIKDGKITARSSIGALVSAKRKAYVIKTPEVAKVRALGYKTEESGGNEITVYVKGEEVDGLIKKLSGVKVLDLNIKAQTLEDIFLHYYAQDSEKGDK